jgi:hypothetical protein
LRCSRRITVLSFETSVRSRLTAQRSNALAAMSVPV